MINDNYLFKKKTRIPHLKKKKLFNYKLNTKRHRYVENCLSQPYNRFRKPKRMKRNRNL